jgi:hypothetical protein
VLAVVPEVVLIQQQSIVQVIINPNGITTDFPVWCKFGDLEPFFGEWQDANTVNCTTPWIEKSQTLPVQISITPIYFPASNVQLDFYTGGIYFLIYLCCTIVNLYNSFFSFQVINYEL